MTFAQQILATLIGTIAGFIFALFLFYITETIKHSRQKYSILKYLRRDIDYNLSLLNKFLSEIHKTITKITANDRQVYYYFKYSWVQRLFLQEAFRFGLLYDKLTDEDLNNLNEILLKFDIGGEGFINSKIKQWKDNTISQQDMLKSMEFERDMLEEHIRHLKTIRDKI